MSYRPPDDGGDGQGSGSEADWLPRNVFGDVVHKAVELGVDPDDESAIWRRAEQFTERHDVDQARIGADDVAEMQRHLRTAIEYLDGLDGHSVVDEKPVRADLGSGEVYGDIDRLIVSEEAYHIVDYKTNRINAPEDIEEHVAHYEWQLKAYAAALHQMDAGRSVKATLLFTDADHPETREWSPEELDRLSEELGRTVKSWVASLNPV